MRVSWSHAALLIEDYNDDKFKRYLDWLLKRNDTASVMIRRVTNVNSVFLLVFRENYFPDLQKKGENNMC